MSQSPESLEFFLQNVLQQLNDCCNSMAIVQQQLSDLQAGQAELRDRIEALSGDSASTDQEWVAPADAWKRLGYGSVFALYADIRKGNVFKPGKEIQKRNSRNYLINVSAILAKRERRQSRKKVI